jgi:hypothetical protein
MFSPSISTIVIAACEDRERPLELRLGVLPFSRLDEHRCVLRAADVEERAQLPARGELPHFFTPLSRPLDVADALARRDEVAADLADPHQVAHLSGGRGHGRRVEAAHPLGDAALVHEREALERLRHRREVLPVEGICYGEGALSRGARRDGIAGGQCDLRFTHGCPRVLR